MIAWVPHAIMLRGGTMEDAMAAALGLSLSLIVTAVLLGWLTAEAERPAPRHGRAGWRRGTGPS